MDLKDLKRLYVWLERKLTVLGPVQTNNNPDEYSEANLAREMLRYLKHCVEQDVIKEELASKTLTQKPYWYPDPMTPHYPYTPITTSPHTATDGICAVCKAKNPDATHCVHRIRY